MNYIVYVQDIEVAKFQSKYLAEWFISKLKDAKDIELNNYVNEMIVSDNFQDCDITCRCEITAYYDYVYNVSE